MNGKKRLLLLIVLIAALLAAAYFLYRSMSAQTEATAAPAVSGAVTATEAPKTEAPDFTVYDYDGNEVTLSSFEGKPAVVNFWASWCTYCMQEMAEFQSAYEKYGDDVAFVMVDLTAGGNDTREAAQEVLDNNGYTFPVYYDDDASASGVFGIRSIPTTYFVDAEGYLVDGVSGPVSADKLTSTLDSMLEDAG